MGDDLESINLAPSAMEACAGAANNLNAGLRMLKKGRGDVEDGSSYAAFLDKKITVVQETTEDHEGALKSFLHKVEYFGEQGKTVDDIVQFLENWKKFVHQYRAAIKFNIAFDKKAKA